jgi:protein SCO1
MTNVHTSRATWIKLTLVLLIGLSMGVALFVATLRDAPKAARPPSVVGPAVAGIAGLFDQGGAAFDPAALTGRYVLVYFGFTHCPDACPTALYSATLALQQLDADATRIQPLFVSVDPVRDTPQQMGVYLANFSSTWIGLTGSTEAIQAVEQQFGIIAEEHRDDSLPGGYTMDHSNEFLLFSPAGRLLTRLPANVTQDELLRQLRSLTVAEAV